MYNSSVVVFNFKEMNQLTGSFCHFKQQSVKYWVAVNSFFHRVYRLHRIIISLDIIKSLDFNCKLTSTSAVISHPLVKTGPCSTWTRNLKVIRSTPIGSIRTFSSEPRVSMTDKNPFLMYSPALKFSITFLPLTALVYRRVDRPPHSWERTHQLKQTWHSDLCETIHFASLGLV